MNNAFTGWRELWLASGEIRLNTTFSLSMKNDGTFITFQRKNETAAATIRFENDKLSVSQQQDDGNWVKLINSIKFKGKDSTTIQLQRTPEGLKLSGDDIAGSVEIPVDLSKVGKVCGSGEIWNFSFEEATSNLVTKALQRVIREVAEFPESQPTQRQDDLIYDFGMHSGSDTEFYLAKGFRVVAIEANPQIAERNATRFAEEINDGRLILLNLGVAEENGLLLFHVSLVNSEQSSFDKDMALRLGPVESCEIKTVNPAHIWPSFGVPYYAKIDIEGFDGTVIDSIGDLAEKPAYVSFESGFDDWPDRVATLSRAGYSSFKVVDQMGVSGSSALEPAREGKTVKYTFLGPSSGPFGEETPGEWVSKKPFRVGARLCAVETACAIVAR
jgi:FkbM family methyltransferase